MKRAALALVLLAACGHHDEPGTADVLACTTLNAAVEATPGLAQWERNEIFGYARHAEDPALRKAATITAVAEACDALHLAPSDINKPDRP